MNTWQHAFDLSLPNSKAHVHALSASSDIFVYFRVLILRSDINEIQVPSTYCQTAFQ